MCILFLITSLVFTSFLLNKRHLTLEIRICLNDNFVLLLDYMSDLDRKVPHRQAVVFKLHRLSPQSINTNEATKEKKLVIPMLLMFDKLGWFKCLYFRHLNKFFFSWTTKYKIHSNNLIFDYPNILINQNDFSFPKLYFSPLIRTKIECINKQRLVDVNWPNKAIWKSELNKAIKNILLFEKLF